MISKPSKRYVLDFLAARAKEKPDLSILDLGSGESLNFLELLKQYPNVRYVGLEPNKSEHEKAKAHLSSRKNISLINGLGYENATILNEKFDIVVSLSVLEHIKNKEKFLAFSAAQVKLSGLIIHLYDLGHALYPKSLKERLHVFFGNHSLTARFLPETKFVAYCDSDLVVRILEAHDVIISRLTYHSMRDHVKYIKYARVSDEEVRKLAELEVALAPHIEDKNKREKLFLSVCIWGIKTAK